MNTLQPASRFSQPLSHSIPQQHHLRTTPSVPPRSSLPTPVSHLCRFSHASRPGSGRRWPAGRGQTRRISLSAAPARRRPVLLSAGDDSRSIAAGQKNSVIKSAANRTENQPPGGRRSEGAVKSQTRPSAKRQTRPPPPLRDTGRDAAETRPEIGRR